MLTADEKAHLIKTLSESSMAALAFVLMAMIAMIVFWDTIDDWICRRRKR